MKVAFKFGNMEQVEMDEETARVAYFPENLPSVQGPVWIYPAFVSIENADEMDWSQPHAMWVKGIGRIK